MGAVIGDLLPLALGIAISPIPIIATILMLLAPRAGGASAGFLLGWVGGIVIATTLFIVLAGGADLGGDDGPSVAASWIKIGLGVLLLLLAARQWRARPASGEVAELPGWMSAIDSFTVVKGLGLGFVLSAVNPKNLLMAVAAGATIGSGDISVGEEAVAVAVFTVIAASTVATPVLAYLVARDRMRHPLDLLKGWLQVNNGTVMGVLLVVIGFVLIGKGVGGL